MKDSKIFGALVFLFVISSFFMPQVGATESFPIVNVDSPVFKQTQTAQQGMFQYQQTMNLKPPFYSGSMPLVFISGKKAIGQSEMITITQDYGRFKNTFTYSDVALKYSGVADGVRTNDSSGRLLAEAKFVKLIEGEGLYIEEQHYGREGKVIFRCKSFIEFRTGFKKEEAEVKGKKQKDYYFLWPCTPF